MIISLWCVRILPTGISNYWKEQCNNPMTVFDPKWLYPLAVNLYSIKITTMCYFRVPDIFFFLKMNVTITMELPPQNITTRAPSSWQTLHNAFELSPSTISKNFQTPLLRDWAFALSCVADATNLVSCLKQWNMHILKISQFALWLFVSFDVTCRQRVICMPGEKAIERSPRSRHCY